MILEKMMSLNPSAFPFSTPSVEHHGSSLAHAPPHLSSCFVGHSLWMQAYTFLQTLQPFTPVWPCPKLFQHHACSTQPSNNQRLLTRPFQLPPEFHLRLLLQQCSLSSLSSMDFMSPCLWFVSILPADDYNFQETLHPDDAI